MDITDKDLYGKILEFSDDRDVLNMLSVNRKFNDPIFFQNILRKRYPDTLQYKPSSQSWRQYYLEVITAVELLKEKFGFIYTGGDVILKYAIFKRAKGTKSLDESDESEKRDFYRFLLKSATAERFENQLDIVEYVQKKRQLDYDEYLKAAIEAARKGRSDIVKYLVTANDLAINDPIFGDTIITSAVAGGNKDLVVFLIQKGANISVNDNILLRFAIRIGDLDLVKYLVENGIDVHRKDNIAVNWARNGKKFEIEKYLLSLP